MTSLLDIMPTILDWFSISQNDNSIYPVDHNTSLPGKSLLPVTANPGATGYDVVFASHNFHEVTMSYPMRSIRNRQYKLIHNMFFPIPYPIAEDIFTSPTFTEMMNRAAGGKPLQWFKSLKQYYYRSQWELYDIRVDPRELQNLVNSSDHQIIFNSLKANLLQWQNVTSDPWICLPWGALWNGTCASMHNENGF